MRKSKMKLNSGKMEVKERLDFGKVDFEFLVKAHGVWAVLPQKEQLSRFGVFLGPELAILHVANMASNLFIATTRTVSLPVRLSNGYPCVGYNTSFQTTITYIIWCVKYVWK